MDQERALRRKTLRRRRVRRHERRRPLLARDQLLMALGATKQEAGRFYAWLPITVPTADQAVSAETFFFRCARSRRRVGRRRAGSYLRCRNLTGRTPAELGTCYRQLVPVQKPSRISKAIWACAPWITKKMARMEAPILVAFLASTLQVCLRPRLKAVAGGLTARAVLEQFCAVQMVAVQLPTSADRTVIVTRHTQPEKELPVLLEQLQLTLPAQPPPKITAAAALAE